MNDIEILHQDSTENQARAYRVEDIAEILEISMTVKKEKFRVVRIGNAIRVSRKSFDTWLDGLGD